MTMASEAVVCRGCERDIELCSFCEDNDCGDPTCYRCVTVETIAQTVTRAEPHVAAERLIDLANHAGGPDNISVAIYRHDVAVIGRTLAEDPSTAPTRPG